MQNMQYVYNAKPRRNIKRLTYEQKSLDDLYDLLASRWAIQAEKAMKRQRKRFRMAATA